ncbi:MAG: Gfo/Idh/MocA family oxidoreductase [Anaerolineae bacterium]|nr:Gfo/Idh/MocA family oxidoreductase [Anaerolineae bacterium]
MKTIRWGIIGVGNVCEVKSGPALQKADHSALVAVMRRTAHLAEDYARRHGVPRWTDEANALIHDPEVDAVYIATPPDTHLSYTLQVAAAGKPVYVEKPMARTYEECQAMIRACQDAGVPLFVAYYRRALPRFAKARELIAAGALGEVRAVHVTMHQPPPADLDQARLPWRFLPNVAGGGLFVDLGSHVLDWLDYALGPIVAARGLAANQAGLYPAEDIVTATWRHDSGVQGTGVWCFTADRRQDEILIIGSRGRLAFPCFRDDPLLLTTPEGTTALPIPNPPHIQQPLIQTIVDALNGQGTCPSTGESAARTSRIIDEILADWRQQTGVTFLLLS